METEITDWKAAFKKIFSKTPTKDDYLIAPSSVRAMLPKSPSHQNAGRKRKMLTLRPNEQKDEEFLSPEKRRPFRKIFKGSTNSNSPMSPISRSDGSGPLSLSPAPSSSAGCPLTLTRPKDPFISPIKDWHRFMASPSQSAKKRGQLRAMVTDPSFLLKTPSPAKKLRRPITYTNLGHLLCTPEKTSPKGEDDVDKCEDEEGSGDGQQQVETGGQIDEQQQPKKRKQKSRKSNKVKGEKPNFVAINLRRRCYAPVSRFGKGKGRGKKRWEWARKKRHFQH